MFIKYTTLIFDLGDVLFNWSSQTKTAISPTTLKGMLSSPTWFEYECGKISQDSCYERIGNQFAFDPSEVANAFAQAQDSLQANNELVSFIRQLKAESNSILRVYAMSNVSRPDYQALRMKLVDWSIFDQVFTSGEVGERKPALAFYRHVLEATGADPQSTIFVDDKSDNVLSARSIGIHGIIFDNTQQVTRALRNLVGDPVKRGKEFLEMNSKSLKSTIEGGKTLDDNFMQLLILEATNNRDMVTIEDHPRTWNFFKGKQTASFPYDLDTTAIALTTYFDHNRPRVDPVVCVNVLSLFYSYGRGAQLSQTLQWVYQILYYRAYLDGTRYYCHPESFLFFLDRSIGISNSPELHRHLKPLLLERIKERIGASGDAVALAMRILVCKSLGIKNEIDARSLLAMQCEDGGWELCWMFRQPTASANVGNRGVTTAFAVNAINAVKEWPE